ncbi:MAG: metal-dependent hydrolase [Desulfosarcinaceae bacterium]|jgi:membrane-bound metal-dependent hydrolase YbcI (DUF457 family)
MPLPLGHTAIGLAACETLPACPNKPSRLIVMGYVAVLANLPDMDVLFGLLIKGNGAAFHRGPAHSLLFAVLAGVIASQLGKLWTRIPRFGIGLCFTLIFSHVLADMLFTPSPVSLLWPLEVYWTPGFNSWGNVLHMVFFKSIQDAGIVAACLAYIAVLRYLRTGRNLGSQLSGFFRQKGHA